MTMGDESFMTEIIFSKKKAGDISPSHAEEELPGKILFFPKNEFLFYMDSSSVLSEKMKSVGINNDKQLNSILRKNAQFSFSQSFLLQHPKPIQCLQFKTAKSAKEVVYVKCIWFKDKIKVYDLSISPLDF